MRGRGPGPRPRATPATADRRGGHVPSRRPRRRARRRARGWREPSTFGTPRESATATSVLFRDVVQPHRPAKGPPGPWGGQAGARRAWGRAPFPPPAAVTSPAASRSSVRSCSRARSWPSKRSSCAAPRQAEAAAHAASAPVPTKKRRRAPALRGPITPHRQKLHAAAFAGAARLHSPAARAARNARACFGTSTVVIRPCPPRDPRVGAGPCRRPLKSSALRAGF